MADAQRTRPPHGTRDHDRIREWVEARGGTPAFVQGARELLRIDFLPGEERACREPILDEVNWQEWFEAFEDRELTFLYSPEADSCFCQLVAARPGLSN